MKASIIIAAYNSEKYLAETLESALHQTIDDYEVIVVDDGSSDGTGQICDKIAKEDSRIRVFHTPNSGVVNARNLGLDTAKGKYIGFVDGDDFLNPKTYEVLFKLITGDADVAVCHIEGIHETENQLEWPNLSEKSTKMTELEALPRLIADFDFISVANKLYDIKVLEGIQFKSVRPEDADFNYRVFKNGITINYSAFSGYACRLRQNSAMRREPIPYILMSRYAHCLFYCQYHRGITTESSRASALNKLFEQIVKTRWEFYDTEFQVEASETALKMRGMIYEEYRDNKAVSRVKSFAINMLYKYRLVYEVAMRIRSASS